jgi:AcrR family transcriptional regulator
VSEISVPEDRRGRQRADLDDRILDAAWGLLAERSFSDWTLDDLAARVDVSRRTLYHHFPSKEAIAAGTLARNLHRMVDKMAGPASELAPEQRVSGVLLWMAQLRARPGLGPVAAMKADGALMAAVYEFPEWKAADQRLHLEFSALIAEAQRAGHLSARWNAEELSRLLIDSVRHVDPSRAPALVAVLFEGLAGPRP